MVEQDRGYLGMTHNPFSSPGEGFFEHGDRKTHLEQLRHLSQWSRRVLLVTGPHDSGKSIMYRQLSASLEPRAKAARVNGTLINTSREVEDLHLEEALQRLPEHHVATVAATELAMRHLGRSTPNTALLGALTALTDVIHFSSNDGFSSIGGNPTRA